MSGKGVRIIRVNHLRPPVILAVEDTAEPPPFFTVSYPGDPEEAPTGTVAVKKQAIYINASRLPPDLREACVEHITKGSS
jgi:hypothetical protein